MCETNVSAVLNHEYVGYRLVVAISFKSRNSLASSSLMTMMKSSM